MGVHRFGRAVDIMQSQLINQQGRKAITHEVKISKFRNNIMDIIKKSIALHLTDDMIQTAILTKLEQFDAANRDTARK